MVSKRIYILGAGSSIGHSKGVFPSITGFFRAAKKLKLGSSEDFRKVLDYGKQVTGRSLVAESSAFDIESFFTHIEIELERTSSPELLAIREQLLKLIQSVLLGLSEEIFGEQGEYNAMDYELRKTDTIITFNWDLLLDNILKREHILASQYNKSIKNPDAKSGHYWQFILDLSALGEGTFLHLSLSKPYQEWRSGAGCYLKMHGSIDWFYCSNEHCRASRKVFPVMEPSQTQYCSECHELLSSLVIPPVLNKGYRQYPLIRRIWNLAAKELSFAGELVIWGYSLPPTDFYALWLLRQARQSPLKKLTIINPRVVNKNNKRPAIAFVRRFYNIFRDKITKDSVRLYESFGDYCNNNDIITKYNLGEPQTIYERL